MIPAINGISRLVPDIAGPVLCCVPGIAGPIPGILPGIQGALLGILRAVLVFEAEFSLALLDWLQPVAVNNAKAAKKNKMFFIGAIISHKNAN